MAAIQQVPQQFQPGFRLIDGAQLNTWLQLLTVGTDDGETAATTQTRAAGTAVKYTATRFSTVANSGDAATLGGAGAVVPAGAIFLVANKGANPMAIFPPGANDKIDGGTAGASVTLTNARIGVFIVTANIGGVLTIVSGYMPVSA